MLVLQWFPELLIQVESCNALGTPHTSGVQIFVFEVCTLWIRSVIKKWRKKMTS